MARLYRVKDRSTPEAPDRLIRAGTKSGAIRAAAGTRFSAHSASADDVAELMGAGVKEEDFTGDNTPEDPSE